MGRSASAGERQAIIARHHAVQRLLEDFTGAEIVVPFAGCISVPADKIVARRAFRFLIGFVRSVALLRVFEKSEGQRHPIVADLEDYRIARELMAPVIRRQLAALTDQAEDLLSKLREEFGEEVPFVAKDVARLLGVGDTQANRRMRELLQSDLCADSANWKKTRHEWVLREAVAVGLRAESNRVARCHGRGGTKTRRAMTVVY
jgi:hypothetical protein